MASIIIGFGTTVTFAGCAISAQWGYSPNAQRLYCLGDPDPRFNIIKPTESLSITIYGDDGSGPTYSMALSTSCADASTVTAGVNPATCGGSVPGVSGDWFVSSYSYSKGDPQMPGQESWSMTRWVAGGDTPLPSYVLRMSAEGEASDATKVGIVFNTSVPLTTGNTGSVSAGGIGQADTKSYGAVLTVGGSNCSPGDIESGSASSNYTPLWIT